MEDENIGKQLEAPISTDRLVWDVWMSAYHLPSLTVADELGLFSLIDARPAPVEEISAALGLAYKATEALVAVLAALGFLVCYGGRFYLSDVSRCYLLPGSPYYWGPMLQLYRDQPVTHSALREALQREPHGEQERNQRAWTARELGPERARTLTHAMHSHSLPAAMGLALTGDFTGVGRLLDVGGGSGCFCIALALRYPSMCFTVLDLPAVCQVTAEYVVEARLDSRIEISGVDMFEEPWPAGHDAILLSNILHDWDVETCRFLLHKGYDTLPPGGRIYIHEILLADTKDRPVTAASFSMHMAIRAKGKQFTAGELKELISRAGFSDIRLTPAYGYFSLLAGRKT